MILQTNDKEISGQTLRQRTVSAVAERTVIPGKKKWLLEDAGNLSRLAIILIIAAPLAGQECMNAVMEVIAPLAAQLVPAALTRIEQSRIIQIAFGDNMNVPASLGHILGYLLQVTENVACSEVENGVDGVGRRPSK